MTTIKTIIEYINSNYAEQLFCKGHISSVSRETRHDSKLIKTQWFIEHITCREEFCDKWDEGDCLLKELIKTGGSSNPLDYNPNDIDWIYKYWHYNSFGGNRITTYAFRMLMSLYSLLNLEERQFVLWRMAKERPFTYKQFMKHIEVKN